MTAPQYLFTLTLLLATTATPPVLPAQEADRFALPKSEEGLPGEGKLRRYNGYVKTWASRRAAWSKQVKQDQKAVVFLGDSITQGWGAKFRGNFNGMKLANRGIGGDTTRGMLIRLQEDVLSLNPSAIVMLMGTNDLEVGLEEKVHRVAVGGHASNERGILIGAVIIIARYIRTATCDQGRAHRNQKKTPPEPVHSSSLLERHARCR